MKKYREGEFRVQRNSTTAALGGVVFMLGACLSGSPASAGTANRTHVSELRTLVASDALSDAAMAKQTGTGLRPQEIITHLQNAGPKVQLWDELRIIPLTAPITSGMTQGGPPPN
jgi:hypothetical protein